MPEVLWLIGVFLYLSVLYFGDRIARDAALRLNITAIVLLNISLGWRLVQYLQ